MIGVRAAGTDGERQGADYILGQLDSYGYHAELQPFTIPIYQGVSTSLEMLSPQQQTFAATLMTYSATGHAQGELIVVPNIGEPGDFPPDTAGRIALVKRGTLPFGDKVANAEAAGAIGVIIYNNQPGPFTATPRGPTGIPAVTISQEDGEALAALAAAGAVTMSMDVQAIVDEGESLNVTAQDGDGDCRVLVGGHMDSVPAGPGANDNASGTGVVLEIARVLAARNETDGVCFALFGAEELGLLGSQYYVSQLTADQKAAMLGILNFDMLAVGDLWPLAGSESLVAMAVDVAKGLGVDAFPGDLPPNVGSDHASFIDAGIPGVLFNCFCDPNYHTAADRFEFVRQDRLQTAGDIGLGMIDRLLTE